jgi:mono/diheme cytochrome c family protein
MRIAAIIGFISLGMFSSMAHADPFERGDAALGKALVEKHCISCHASSYGGDGSGIYTRDDRKVRDGSALVQQIRNCNTNLGLQWFEDEEIHVARYLNNTYYHFDR